MRVCTGCKLEKPVSEFSKDKKGKGGLRSRCKPCDTAAVLARRDPARASEAMRKWRDANKEHVALSKANYKESNPDCDRAYYQKNRDLKLAKSTEWKKQNSERHANNQAKRRARIKGHTPAWADNESVIAVYRRCREMRKAGHDVQVDHIVPLNGKTVSGLHCAANLQIIPSTENAAKRNLYWPEMPQ